MLRIGSKNKVGTGGTAFCGMLKVQRDLESVTVAEEKANNVQSQSK